MDPCVRHAADPQILWREGEERGSIAPPISGDFLALENEIFAGICGTEDKNEGITAFLEKRKPRFKAR